jgi:hypothetical protein
MMLGTLHLEVTSFHKDVFFPTIITYYDSVKHNVVYIFFIMYFTMYEVWSLSFLAGHSVVVYKTLVCAGGNT